MRQISDTGEGAVSYTHLMTDAIRLQGMLWETLAGFLEQAKLDGEELKEHSPLIGQMFELAQNPVSAATHVRTLAQQLLSLIHI